jgi:acyl-coenzyme A thioesterase PaaI-like protein
MDLKMERTKTISWDDPQRNKRDAAVSISGLDYLRAIKEDRISPPPVADLVGYKMCEVDNGYAAFELNKARPIHVGKKLATVEGKVKDKNGVLHAHGVSTCLVFKIA